MATNNEAQRNLRVMQRNNPSLAIDPDDPVQVESYIALRQHSKRGVARSVCEILEVVETHTEYGIQSKGCCVGSAQA